MFCVLVLNNLRSPILLQISPIKNFIFVIAVPKIKQTIRKLTALFFFPLINMQTNSPLMPREKLLEYGVEALEDHELLAIFLRTGIKGCPVMELSHSVLQHFGSLRALLSADKEAFCKVKGLGITQFIQLQATTEMTKRYLKQELLIEHVFSDTSTVKLYLQAELHHEEREIFMVLFLDNQHRLIKKAVIFRHN